MGRRKKTEPRRRNTTVHDLPDECLALVFPFLKSKADRDAASLTCRRWRALDALSRHSLHVFYSKGDEWPHLHHRLLRALKVFPHILSLIVCCFGKKLPSFFLTIFPAKALAQLQSVEFDVSHSSNVNDAFVQSLAGCCPALRHLGITMCKVTDVGLCALAQGCRHLMSLDVSISNVTDKGIDMVLTMCPNMEFLDVSENYNISGWGFRHGKRLRRLYADYLSDSLIEGLQFATGPHALDPDNTIVDTEALGESCQTLAVIGTCCKLLVALHLSLSGLYDFSLQAIARGCLNLKVLEVNGCGNITFLGWQAVALSCLKLELLNVQGCNQFCEESLFAIYKGCPSLTHFKISHRFFPPNPVFKLFQMSRQSVDVTFYDDRGCLCPLVST